MKAEPTTGLAGATFRAACVTAALTLGAGTSMAADATLKITSFSASAAEFSGNFAFGMDPYQSYNLSAIEAGGLFGQSLDNYSAGNWNQGLNRLAQTANANATGNTVQFTDALTQLTTAGFNLSAQTVNPYALPALPNYANASAVQSGTFMLFDENGVSTAGTITFDLYYDMIVTSPSSSATTYSQTALNLLSSSDSGESASFSDGMLSSMSPGGTGTKSGHFTWSYTLAAGQAGYYTLSGSAFAVAAAVPEPGTCALMAFGLAGVAAMSRRRRIGNSTGA